MTLSVLYTVHIPTLYSCWYMLIFFLCAMCICLCLKTLSVKFDYQQHRCFCRVSIRSNTFSLLNMVLWHAMKVAEVLLFENKIEVSGFVFGFPLEMVYVCGLCMCQWLCKLCKPSLPSSQMIARHARTMRSRSCKPSLPTAIRELATELGKTRAFTAIICEESVGRVGESEIPDKNLLKH